MLHGMKVMRRCLSILFFFLVGSVVYSQDLTHHNWYFGNSPQGIIFNRIDNTATLVNDQATPFGTGGSGVITDAVNANLLFYTDGQTVYDVTHKPMPNGGGLNANTNGNQPVAVSPVPGQTDQYYIFTNTANYTTGGTISHTTVDMTQFGNAVFPVPALGDVTNPKNTAVAGLTGRSEGMIVIPHSNGTEYWLISHKNNSDTYSSTRIKAGGTFTTTNFNALTGLNISVANFSYNAATGMIAVSPQGANRNVVILNFNNTTGGLTFNRFIPNSAVTTASGTAIYDTEWSPSGQYLYISIHGDTGVQADVFQFDLTNPSATLTSVLPQPNNIFRSYGLELGPDTLIYHLYQATSGGPFLLGSLANPDSTATATIYKPAAFNSNPDINGTQFPAFSPKAKPNLSVTFVSTGACSGVATNFYPTVTPDADSLLWDLGDGSASNEWSPVHDYQAGGNYNVKVTAFLHGDTASFNAPVNITQFDLKITLVQDTAACHDEFPPPYGSSSPQQFTVTAKTSSGTPTSEVWSNGDTGLTLKPDSAGYYYIVVGDATGCQAYAGVNVREYGNQDQRANIWYFGNEAGIDFNQTPAVATSNPSMNAPEGCAVFCDRNGEILLYTDGQSVWNKNDSLVDNNIGGDPSSTQSSLIVPVPNDETLYYIFTTQAVDDAGSKYELRYSLFDLKLNSGTGGISQSGVLLFSRSAEQLTGNANWLIAHEFGNNTFRAYPITQDGIGEPILSSVGSAHGVSPVAGGQGYMKLGAQNRLAVALSNPGVSNVVEVFDFDVASGKVSNERTANLNNPSGQVYGVEFSPAGNKLFATLKGNPSPSMIYEFAFDSLGIPHFKQSVSKPSELGELQIAPDGQIYMAINNSNSLSVFSANEDTTKTTALTSVQTFNLVSGTMSKLGLPNFIQHVANPPSAPSILATGLCLGDSTSFAGTGTDPVIDMFEWFFGDGFSASGQSVKHLYGSAGTYNVSLEITNRCGLDTTLRQKVTIVNKPANPTFLPPGQQPVICSGPLTLEATPASNPNLPNLSFLWSNGDTTRTTIINQVSQVSVTITNTSGCTSNGSVIVGDARPLLNLGPDVTLCQNVPVAPLDAQNPGDTYQWTLNGANSGTGQTHVVSTATPGNFVYMVNVTDPVVNCTAKDTITYSIKESPTFTLTPGNTTACGSNTGKIDVTIDGPASGLFTYFVNGPGTSLSDVDQPLGPIPTFMNLGAGTYAVTIDDQISGCGTTSTAGISDIAFTVSGSPLPPLCDPIAIGVTVNPAITAMTYQVVDQANNSIVDSGSEPAGSTFNTAPVVSGNYLVQVKETSSNCVAVSPAIAVQQNPVVPVTFDLSDICNGNVTAVAPGASFDWSSSPAGSFSGPSSQATLAVNSGTWTVIVIANDGANCPSKDSVKVTVNPVTTDFIQSDACSDQVTLSATTTPAGGKFTYRWYRNGSLIVGGQQLVVGVGDNGVKYRVEAVSTVTGCKFSSVQKTVNVAGDLQVVLTTTTPCVGSPFTLTATPNLAGTTFQWSYNGSKVNGATLDTLQANDAGNYAVAVSLPGCTVNTSQDVILAPVTSGKLDNKYLICNNAANPDPNSRQVVLDPGDQFNSYQWLKEQVDIGVSTETYTATEVGDYSVNLINFYGCASTDKTMVVEECNPRVVAPNAFRPGSSINSNSNFSVFTYFVDDDGFQIFIFNRWGQLVFQSDQRDFKWNGGLNNNPGQPLPPGTYSYVVKYKSIYRPEDGIQSTRGGVLLLR